MARKSVEFQVIVHGREYMRSEWAQERFADFYVGQVRKTLETSCLEPREKEVALAFLCATFSGRSCAED